MLRSEDHRRALNSSSSRNDRFPDVCSDRLQVQEATRQVRSLKQCFTTVTTTWRNILTKKMYTFSLIVFIFLNK